MQSFMVFPCIRFSQRLTREGVSPSPGELQVTTRRADAEVPLPVPPHEPQQQDGLPALFRPSPHLRLRDVLKTRDVLCTASKDFAGLTHSLHLDIAPHWYDNL